MLYFGIGSYPHHETLEELTDEWDQLIPVFIRGQAAKIVHYDPQFGQRKNFLNEYFEKKGFTKVDEFQWTCILSLGSRSGLRSQSVEITLFPKRFDHPDDDHILEELAEDAIRNNTKLIVQEFTGGELTNTFKAIYAKSSSPDTFKRNVLFDITYGSACHCMTDMVKYRPLYDSKGDFINFLLYSEEENIKLIGLNERLDELIKAHFVKKYLEVINKQVDYRRRLKGDTVFFPCAAYNDSSTPDEIMMYLQSQIRPLIEIFDMLGMLPPRKKGIAWNLIEQYRAFDIYEWNTLMIKLVSPN